MIEVPEGAVLAYYFGPADGMTAHHNDASLPSVPLVAGLVQHQPPPLELCSRGLHGSEQPIDALDYARSLGHCCRTYHAGEIERGDDKLCSTERGILSVVDATNPVMEFLALMLERGFAAERAAGREPDHRSAAVIDVLRRFIAGTITDDELAQAAWDARDAWDAWAAWDAWDASAARAASAARDARAARAARAASAAWDASAASAARAAWAAWAASAASAAERAWQNATLTRLLTEAHERATTA